MKLTFVFRHQVKTSRRFIFENIMDLDHVCALHKRWFRNLRIVTQRPDYVEYRLTSLFYGLRQETRVCGGPIDQDRYWYEFRTPLARMRVDGLLEGPDGEVTQAETITFHFPWPLAPFFWFLRPLFRRQKDDILRADTSLLERVYDLERKGFKRLESTVPRVVVYGGNGFFGRLVVEDLLKHSTADIVIASRRAQRVNFGVPEPRVKFVQSDISDYRSVLSTVEGARVVLSCIGPYQGQSLNLLRACIDSRVPYVDVADDKDFIMRCHELASEITRAEIPAFIGCSVVPGMSSLLTKYCQAHIPVIEKSRIFIAPGTRHPRGPGSFLCLLSTVGQEFCILRDGRPERVEGWTGRERVCFPPPLGGRWVYFVVDVADYVLQPSYFGARSVEFKIGSELDVLNRCLSGLREARKILRLKTLDRLLPLCRGLLYCASVFGTSRGALMVEVSSRDHARPRKVSMCVFAESRGEVIPSILPSIATQMILKEEIGSPGIVLLPDWLPREKFANELGKSQVKMALKTADSDWIFA